MSKKLAGTLFIRNGITYDYCYLEAIKCLQEFCDFVFVIDAGSTDGTAESLEGIQGFKTAISYLKPEDWEAQQGKEKLSYFSNIAAAQAEALGFEYMINLQGDEVIHEKSYEAIRRAIETKKEAYMVSRINLWRSPYTYLNVPQNRLPCSTQIIRLTKTKYRSIDDAESIDAQCVLDFVDQIKIYHMGYVRKREVMKAKVINMQRDVFGMTPDEKLNGSDLFNPDNWFDPKEDLALIDEPLPLIIQDWAAERVYE